ncbi:MAG: toll/interleukin-1 receptor domain-containing protein [Chthoniobacterales bacterium]
MGDDSKQWSKLLQAIARGVVIPIIGRGLLRIQIDGREELLYDYLATQLAAQLEVECAPGASMDQVVAAYLNASRQNSRDDVNLKTFEILSQLRDAEGKIPVPEPLRQLATIKPLRLFISTTVDSLLANALGSPPDHVFAYAPNAAPTDIPRDYLRLPHTGRIVFHLFGRISGIPDSALIDEETLEFMWKLHEESISTRLVNLFDELRTNRLLLIGNNHADWLARFFVRLARRDRLYSGSDTREFVVDGTVVSDTRLRDFLENFSPQTRSFGVANPIDFVAELAEKWKDFPDKPDEEGPGLDPFPPPAKPPAVFLSYASQDRAAVERLQSSLGGAGLDVWFDKGCLQPGDPWWKVIDRNIATCDVFIPVISANTNQRHEGIFLREWNRALDRLKDMDRARARFIHPVIVDDTAEGAVTFDGFREFHYARAAGGEPQSDFIKTLTSIVRERRLKAAAK